MSLRSRLSGHVARLARVVREHRHGGPLHLIRTLRWVVWQALKRRYVYSYSRWVARYDRLNAADIERLRTLDAALESTPLISVLLPVYDCPEQWLRRAIESVRAQVYPHWELCIADDASPAPHVRRVLDEYAAADARIKVVYRERCGHISAASNSALGLATGEFVAYLDHDDELTPHALHLVAAELARWPQAMLVYTDEDKIDDRGRRFLPHFKPAWNPLLLLAYNYITHLAVYRTSLVRELGGLREGFEGSQDHDLALRVCEKSPPGGIRHVPHICYHWRSIPGSTGLDAGAKPYAVDAARRALEEHLRRDGWPATLEAQPYGTWRLRQQLADPLPRVSAVIPTRDRVQLLANVVSGLLERTDYPALEVVIVDNQSAEPDTLAYLASIGRDPRVRVVRHDQPFNYPQVNATGVAACTGELLALLNNDLDVLHPDWLREMVGHALRPDVGIVGARLLYPDRRIQHGGVILGIRGVAGHAHNMLPHDQTSYFHRARVAQNLSAVTGACMVMRRAVYEQAGGLDPELRVAFNDIDLCLRVLALGYRNVYTPHAELLHLESASRGSDLGAARQAEFQREVGLMHERWGDLLRADPCYSPNLTLLHEDFGLAFPPRAPRPWRD